MCKVLLIDDVGVSMETVFQKIRPGDGFETGDLVKEESGGAQCRWGTIEGPSLLCNILGLFLKQGVVAAKAEPHPT